MERVMAKGTLVLVQSTEALNRTVDAQGGVMGLFGGIVRKFHGKLLVTASDERDGLCFLRKFTGEGWVDICVEEGKPGTGLVPFPAAALIRVDHDVFCGDGLEDIVLVKREAWFDAQYGSDLSRNPRGFAALDQVRLFHGKVLRTAWAETARAGEGFRVLRKFTEHGWVDVLDNDRSGFLLFPEETIDEFVVDDFFAQLT